MTESKVPSTNQEWLDIVDEQGIPTGKLVERTIAHREGIRHRSSHVWLFRIRKNRVQILLQKRSPGKDSFPGCYDISSAGHIPAGVDFIPSALRELQEELGVTCDAAELDYCGQRCFYYEMEFYGELFKDRQVSNVYALWLDKEEADFSLQQEEVQSVKWFDFAECCELIRHNQISHCIYVEEMELLADYLQGTGKLQLQGNERSAEQVLEQEKKMKAHENSSGIKAGIKVEIKVEIEGITPATTADLDRILEIFDIAKQYMRDSGNPNQWNSAYPDRDTLEKDIGKQQLYVYRQSGVIHAVFVLLLGEEPTYAYIEGEGWLNDEPYGTVHRIASDGTIKGIFAKCMEFCKTKIQNIRIDTHHDNHTMQHLAEKYGFTKCGIIYLKNGSPRIAYHYQGKMPKTVL